MLEELKKYKWASSPPDPWLDHFNPPLKTLYCPTCDEWKVPGDSIVLWTNNIFKCSGGGYDKDKKVPIRVPIICSDCGDTELILCPEGYRGSNKWMWWKHSLVPINKGTGVSPKFINMLVELIDAGKSVQVTFTGRAGQGKSYFMLKMAQILNPFITINELVFERDEFVKKVRTAKPKTIMCVDETTYIAGKHSWMNPDQRQMMLIWESMRFKLLPVFTTVINISLFDKTLREQLVTFQINVCDRGIADVYSLHPHPLTDYVGKHHIQRLYFDMPDWNFCKKKSCLLPRCKHIKTCPLLRGQYEYKKDVIQDRRYKEVEDNLSSARDFISWLEEFLDVMDECYYEIGGKLKLNRELIQLELGCTGSMAQRIRQVGNIRNRDQIQEYIDKSRNK